MTNAEMIAQGLAKHLTRNADDPEQDTGLAPYRSEHGTDAAEFCASTPLGRFRVQVVEVPE